MGKDRIDNPPSDTDKPRLPKPALSYCRPRPFNRFCAWEVTIG